MNPHKTPGGTVTALDASHWLFDLDNTLYSGVHGVFEQIDRRMQDYVARLLDLGPEEARKVQKEYFREYGTTLSGLMRRHKVDPVQFLDYVHEIDLSAINPDAGLGRALEKIPGRKIVFTNADTRHAERILGRLGIGDVFDGIFDIAKAGYVPKPAPETYEMAVREFAINPGTAIMVEDMARNLVPAKEMGMTTLWVKSGSACSVCSEEPEGPHVDYQTDDLAGWLAGWLGR